MIRSPRELQHDRDQVFDGARFSSLVQHLFDVIAVLDRSGRIVYVTPSAETLTGVPPVDLLGTSMFDLLSPAAGETGRAYLASVRTSAGTPRSFEASLRHRDNGSQWVEVSMTDLLDDPSVQGIVVTLHDITRRVSAEEALRRSEERFRSLVQNSSDMIALVDHEGRIEYVSPAVSKLLGYTPEELLHRSGWELFHPDSTEDAMTALAGAMDRPGEDVVIETWVKHRDGHYVKLASTVRNLLHDPSVRAIVINNRDVTDRAVAEEQLRSTEAKYRSLVEDVPAVMYLAEFGADGRWHYASPYIQTLLGWSPEEWVADPLRWYESLHPTDRDRVVAEDEAALETNDEDFFASEYRMIRRDGKPVWVRDEFRIARDNNGTPMFMRGVIVDISHRKKADAALREKSERIRSIFEHSPLGIGLVDLEGRTIETNDVLRKMLGYSEDEFASISFTEFTHPDDVDENLELFDEMAAGKRDSFQLEKRFLHRQGQTIWANLVVSLIRGEDGQPAYALGMTEDISHRKQLEEQLRQAQKMEAIGRLAGGVAHDFNNLLAVIINCANFLAEDMDPADPLFEDVRDIREAGLRGADLVRQLLAFSRKEIVRPEIVDLNEVVENMKNLLGRTLGEDIALDTTLSDAPCVTKVDVGQIEQILVNLAVNARDAMPDGGRILITTDVVMTGSDLASLTSFLEPESYVRLMFTDTGVGMTDDVQRQIFEPFFTTKSRGRGTGLGLATTYGAVQQAGGHISVWSQPGHGTTFTIYLPHAQESPHESPEPRRGHQAAARGLSVLLVEDDDSLRRLTRRMLERNGFAVEEAAHAEAAASVYEVDPSAIDIVLTDVILPGGSGKDLMLRVKELDPNAHFLFMSGYPEDVIADHGVLEEGVPFLGKPFTEQALVQHLQDVIDEVPTTSS
ncbi:MAG TPA: PAS domain S-box protein [Actinomycetota bacterium]|nr:PAS domain S-box protein [Actinomycetota bacterium]